MILYLVDWYDVDNGCRDPQYFGLIAEALAFRQQKLDSGEAQTVYEYSGSTLRVEKLTLAPLKGKAKVLALLNQRGFVRERVDVLPAWAPPEEVQYATDTPYGIDND